MRATIRNAEIKWNEPIRIEFGFTGLSEDQAIPIIRRLISDSWTEGRRPSQCVYVIRLRGTVAVSYGDRHSPVIYIGEGNAFNRLYSHVEWISKLLLSVPQAQIEVHVAQVSRRNNFELYKYIEADLIAWFRDEYGRLPWFNRQSERSKEAVYTYGPKAKEALRRRLLIGSGNKFMWAIRPTPINEHHRTFSRGIEE